MKKRLLTALLAVSMVVTCIFGLTACSNAESGGEKPKEEVTAPVDGTEETIKNLQRQIADLQEQIKKLTDKVNDSETENKKLSDEIKKLEAENKKLSDRISVLEGKPVLDAAKELEIKTAYYNLHKEDFGDCTTEDIKIKFFGEYNGSYVMFIHSVYFYACVESPEVIDGVLFNYSSGHKLDVYNNGNFYTVSKAFEIGLLTHNDLLEITSIFGEFINSFGRF